MIATRAGARTEPDVSTHLVLELRDVRRQFGSVPAVDGLSLTITPGEVFTLLGPSGRGKSTTLRIVAGVVQPAGPRGPLAGRLPGSRGEGFSPPPHARPPRHAFHNVAPLPPLNPIPP